MKSNLRVLLVGDVMLDVYWEGLTHRISPEAPVPVLSVTDMNARPGGAANVAANLAKLGSPVTLLAPVGEDESADQLRHMLTSLGVRFEGLSQATDYLTTKKIRCLSRGQQLLRTDFEVRVPPSLQTTLAKRFVQLLPEHDLVVLSDYDKGALHECQSMIQQARHADKPVFIDPKGQHYERYQGATVLKPNLSEFTSHVGRIDNESHFCRLGQKMRQQLGIDHLLVTRGEEGMSLFNHQGIFHQPAQSREVYDVCGAGDTVLAVLVHMMALGHPISESMRWANAAAGLVVGRRGTAQVSFSEIERCLGALDGSC